jgi:hypothetical protein
VAGAVATERSFAGGRVEAAGGIKEERSLTDGRVAAASSAA